MRRATFVLAFCLLGSSAVFAAGPSPSQTAASDFVQKFYDWYVPIAHKPGNAPSSDQAVAKRGAAFDPPLLRALKIDAEAQRKSPDDIVGLDFDPFLNAQDFDDKYVVGNVTENGGVYLVSVYGVRNGKRAAKPDVVAELKVVKGSFQFTNFRYGADGDLLGILKTLADERAHAPQ
jgi:hypothetical protein